MPRTIQNKPSKTIQCIRMLKILKSKQYIKKDEMASLLGEETTRNIVNYKNALYDAGYYIDYKPGKYGGYHLVHDTLLPNTLIKEETITALTQIYEYALKDKNFVNRQLFLDFVSNILSTNDSHFKESNSTLFGHFPLAMSDADIQKRYYTIQTAIDSKRKVKIKYKGYHSDIERIIHPYKLFKYQNWHVYAEDIRENQKEPTYTQFKLHRIKELEILDEEFKVDINYDENEHFTARGLSTDTPIYLKLKIYGPLGRMIDEKIYGENQVVTIENKRRKNYNFEATMYDRGVVIKFVLSMGSSVKVLEPKWLQKVVIDNSKKIIEFYKRDM